MRDGDGGGRFRGKRNIETDGERETTKRRERERWLKYSVSLLTDMWTDSRKRPRSDNTDRDGKTTDVWAGLLIMCPDGQSCLQADCSYCTVQCHLLTDMTGAKATTAHTHAHTYTCIHEHSHLCMHTKRTQMQTNASAKRTRLPRMCPHRTCPGLRARMHLHLHAVRAHSVVLTV